MDAQGGPMLKQIKQLGINAKFITGDGGCTGEIIKLAGDAIGPNAYCTQPGLPLDKMPGGKVSTPASRSASTPTCRSTRPTPTTPPRRSSRP